MRTVIFMLLLLLSSNAWSRGKAYLDIEENQLITIFNKPGHNWKTCSTDPSCRAVAWPDRNAHIEVTSPNKKLVVPDPYTGEKIQEEFVQVNYRYKREVNGKTLIQEGVGWVDAAYVASTRKNSFYGVATEPTKDDCNPQSKVNGGAREIQKSLAPLEKTLSHKSVTQAAELLKPHIGKCVINPKKPPQKGAAGNPFDSYVLPHLRKTNVPKIVKDNGSIMSEKDLIDIDALARTLYAEMARCYKNGLQYPMTVAKIAVNRAEAKDRHREFIKDPHASNKGNLARVTTSATQFSLWLTKIGGKPNNSLKQALCPPSNKSNNFWTGSKPPPFETDIWENTLRIATEAVLYPNQFKARTKNVKQFFYTSGMKGFYGMKQVNPTIEDRKVARDSCVQVWDEGPKI